MGISVETLVLVCIRASHSNLFTMDQNYKEIGKIQSFTSQILNLIPKADQAG